MSAEVDLKTLWKKEEAKDIPDTKELFKKAACLRKAARIRLVVQTLVLSGTVAVLLYVGININHRPLITTIGLVLMVAAIISYLIVANQLLPILFKSDIEGSSQEYLGQLIRIKRKHEFLDKVMVNIYFSFLSIGLLLFNWQFANKLDALWAAIYYITTFGLMGLAWIWSRRTWIRKKQKSLNDIITKLEAVNEQLRDND